MRGYLVPTLLALYFVPVIVASARGHISQRAIFWLNALLGWTVLGWIVALVWAMTGDTKQAAGERDAAMAAAWAKVVETQGPSAGP